MENYVFHPIISTFTSILLLLGCYELGDNIIRKLKIKNILTKISILEYQYITTGIVFLLIIIFPLVSFLNHATIILQLISLFLIFCSLNFFIKFKYIKKNLFISKNKNIYLYLFVLLIFLYFLLGLSPLTSADVLDYHAGVALNILRFDKYIILPEWFTSLQSGTGETLNALGFSVGAEQFGSLVQFSSILTISGIILKFAKKNTDYYLKYFLVLTILSCPILIFLLSGNKPQIFYSGLILIAFSFNFAKFKRESDIIKAYLIINILICLAVTGKFSFNLSGFLVWAYSTINFLSKKNFYKLLPIPLIIFVFLYFPFLFWKISNLGGDLLTYLFSPFPLHLPGYETFLNHNKGSQEIPFPYFLIYTTPSRFTEFLAANSILLLVLIFFIKTNRKVLSTVLISVIFIIVSNLYASPSARYYLDILLWITLALSTIYNLKLHLIIKYFFYPQILVIFLVLIYSNFIFLPGTFSEKKYLSIKHNYAYLYSGFDWLNNNLSDETKVVILNRPISQYKNFSISGNFNYFTNKNEAIYYKKLIKKYDPEFVVFFGNKPDFRHLNNCIKDIYLKKKKYRISCYT